MFSIGFDEMAKGDASAAVLVVRLIDVDFVPYYPVPYYPSLVWRTMRSD